MPTSEVLIALHGGVPKGSLVKLAKPQDDLDLSAVPIGSTDVVMDDDGYSVHCGRLSYWLFYDEIEVLRWGPEQEETCDQR